jgi:hypothetical protein
METYTKALGAEWREVSTGTVDFWTPGEVGVLTFRAAYSVQGPPFLQIEESGDPRLWPVRSYSYVHHLGFWSDDLDSDAAQLFRAGMQRVTSFSREGVEIANVHRAENGPSIELITSAWRGRFA